MQRLSAEDKGRQRVNILLIFSVQLQNDGYQNDENINGDRILLLEQQITQLNRMVDMLKAQVLYDFLVTVKSVPHECVIRTGQP